MEKFLIATAAFMFIFIAVFTSMYLAYTATTSYATENVCE